MKVQAISKIVLIITLLIPIIGCEMSKEYSKKIFRPASTQETSQKKKVFMENDNIISSVEKDTTLLSSGNVMNEEKTNQQKEESPALPSSKTIRTSKKRQ